jgi:cobalamin biosynthetic protein CobC
MRPADHGGGIDAARARWGGARSDWIDLSTGINPHAYPLPALSAEAWTTLPDSGAEAGLVAAARRFWRVPEAAAVLAAPGTSALIARVPGVIAPEMIGAGRVAIPGPTYNEHARAFRKAGWTVTEAGDDPGVAARVIVHPNNPDGRLWRAPEAQGLVVIDESFADTCPQSSLIAEAARPGRIVLKGLGKFWGLAGLRLGFAMGDPALIAQLADLMGPWPVSGPALAIGTAALADEAWAGTMRARLDEEAARLDTMLARAGARVLGGTSLFRLAEVPDARHWQETLARRRIWTRVFPYSRHWLRLGLPGSDAAWGRLARALETVG